MPQITFPQTKSPYNNFLQYAWSNPHTIESVNIDSLVASQNYIDTARIEDLELLDIPTKPISIDARSGELIIRDGHHRATLAKLRGQSTIRARIWR